MLACSRLHDLLLLPIPRPLVITLLIRLPIPRLIVLLFTLVESTTSSCFLLLLPTPRPLLVTVDSTTSSYYCCRFHGLIVDSTTLVTCSLSHCRFHGSYSCCCRFHDVLYCCCCRFHGSCCSVTDSTASTCCRFHDVLLPLGDLLPSGCRSYYKDLLLRISILETQYRSILRSKKSKLLSKPHFEHHTARSNSNSFETQGANPPLSNRDNGADALPLWSRFDFAIHTGPAIDRRTPDNLL